jgi:hypothetical protein
MKRQLSFVAVAFLILTTALSVYAIYDQIATGTWGPAGTLAESRNGAAAVRLDDGRVLFVGGSGPNGALSSAEALTAGAGFSSTAAMSEARKGHTATKLKDGRVLVVGGDNGSGATLTAEIYDPSSDSWSAAGNLATARSGHTASLLKDGRVLIAGGANSGGPVSSLEVFDPAANAFSSAGTLQTGRSGHAAAVLQSGRVLIAGGTGVGQDGNPVTLKSVEIFDPETGSVSSAASLGSARAGHSATTLLDGKVLVMGGNDGAQDLASSEIYDAAADTWTATSSAASTRSGHAAFLLPNNNNVLIVGGKSAGNDLASAELYEPWSGNFKSTGAMAATHSGIAGAAVGAEGFLAAAGGASGEVHHFATVKTDKGDYSPGEYANVSGSGWQPGETVTFTFHEDLATPFHPDEVETAVADPYGNVSGVQYLLEEHDLGLRYYLTAVGAASQARTTFTDARNWNLNFAGTGTGSVTITTSAGTIDAPVSCGGTVSPAASQTVTSTCLPNITTNVNGATITFNAIAGAGSTFAGWSSGSSVSSSTCSGATNPCQLVLSGNGSLTVTFNAVTASKYLVTASNNSPIAGSTITITAQLADSSNNPVAIAGKVVTWSKTGLNGSFGSSTSTTDASGIATVSFTTDTVSGRTYTFTATDDTLPVHLTGTSGNVTTVAGAATKYAVTSSDNNPVAGSAVTISAQLEDTNGNAVSTAGRTVNWTNTGTGASFSPSASSLTNASGIATVTFTTAPTPGTYTVTATDTLGATGTTSNITTKVGPPAKLAFAQQPTDAIVGAVIAPAVAVQLQDANGNLTSISGTPITVSILNNPGAGTLAGTLTVNTASGTATFSDLSINNAGNGYTLKAHDGVGINDATSGTFNINKKDQTITFGALGTKTYGDADFNVSASASSGLAVNFTASGNCTVTGTLVHLTGAGSCTITAHQPGDTTTWNAAPDVPQSFTINKAHLTVTADDKSRVYFAADPTFTATISGFVNGETLGTSGVSGSASCSSTAVQASPASPPTYPITCTIGSLAATNYDFPPANFLAGALTILKAPSTTTVTGGTFVFDGNAHPGAVTVTGAGGLSLTPTATYSGGCTVAPTHVNETTPTTCTASYSFGGDANHDPSSGSDTIVITKATSATVVSGGGTFVFDGTAHEATVAVTGAGGLNLTPAPSYSCVTAPVHVAETPCTASYTFGGDDDHFGSNGSATITITKATSTTVVSFADGPTVVFDGNAHPATVHVSGVGGLNQTPLPNYAAPCLAAPVHVSETPCTASYTFAGDDDHFGSNGSDTITITKANSTTVVSFADGPTVVFDGNAHPATVHVSGAGGLNLTPAPDYAAPCLTAPVHVSETPCIASYTFGGDDDHFGSSGSATITITKANSTTVVSFADGVTVVFDGNAHPATVHVSGAGGLNMTPAPDYAAPCLAAPVHVSETPCTASYSFPGDGDHFGSSDSATITITKANSTTVVSGGGTFVYDNLPHPATVAVTGVGGLSLTPAPVYSGACSAAPVNVNETPCTASYTFTGDSDHFGSSDSTTITITKAPSNTVVSGGGAFVYDALPHAATVSVTGVNLSLTPAPVYSGACSAAPVHVADTPCTASYMYPGDADHFGSNSSTTITITKAPSVTTIGAGYTVIYNGLPHGVTANVTGVGGLNQGVAVVYTPGGATVPVNPGTYSASATFAGDADHLGSSAGPVTITITFGTCNAGVGPGGVILPPINSDGTSVYSRKGGSTIPVKFTVCDASGNPIGNPAVVFAGTGGTLTMLSAVRGTVDAANESTMADIPDVAFRWTGSQWIFNMGTSNLTSATTYVFRINLAYGSIVFQVGVK